MSHMAAHHAELLGSADFYQTSSPALGFVRLKHIIGDPNAEPPTPPLIPVSRSSWWHGCRTGRYPKPTKLGPRTTVWKLADILELIEQIEGGAA